ncbi:MAG: TlpA disulfide reductase family protein [Arachidicoccus sp.]|nr:TlpA disulfide reductase family protein [Arachidicoccus sp.]
MKKLYLIILLMLSVSLKNFAQKDTSDLITTGQQVPSFSFEIEKGKTVSINDYKGKLVLINLFATWCPPCNEELPLAQKDIWDKHKDNPHFAFFVFGREQDWAKVLPFKEKKGFTFPILPDEGRKIYSLFAKSFIPRNYLVDENGKIIYQSMGFSTNEFQKLVQIIDQHLKNN